MIDINKINGNEIIEFLNKEIRDNDELCDISVQADITFVSQYINTMTRKDEYVLEFTASYNNWGTDQEIEDNSIHISKDGSVTFRLDEPFDMDDSGDLLEDVLTKWLKTHEFDSNSEEKCESILREAYQSLGEIGYNNVKELQEVIDKLIKARTYMK